MLWVLSLLNPFVTFTKLYAKVSLWPLLYITARSLRSDPSWWLESRFWHTATTGPDVPFTSAQNVVLMRQSCLGRSHIEMAFVGKPLSGKFLSVGKFYDFHELRAGRYSISCLQNSFPDLRLITILFLSYSSYYMDSTVTWPRSLPDFYP